VPSKAQQSKRLRAAEAPASELLFVLLMRAEFWMGVTRGRDLIFDCVPILAWRRADPDAVVGPCPGPLSPPAAARLPSAYPAVSRHRPAAPEPLLARQRP